MTGIVLLSTDPAVIADLQSGFAKYAPQLSVMAASAPEAAQAAIAVCWYPPPGILARLPNLQLVHSIAAGVDHLMQDTLPPGIPLCRIVDPELKRGMVEYMRWAALHYHRGFDDVLRQQKVPEWRMPEQVPAARFSVGVMGLGTMGGAVAADLATAGYAVRGWATTKKNLPHIKTFHGPDGLAGFFDGLDMLVNLLPLTPKTRHILCEASFSQLAPGAVLVNGGRGQHLVLSDLDAALDSGQLRAALLDVFEEEPLPYDNPLWRRSGVTVTPHMASSASLETIVLQVAENLRRLLAGQELANVVDLAKGY